ncbi:hypothetical protein ACFWDZ_19495 [Micromonospora aurantiaca]|uniref:Uncharacterized protein n=1 Tax=Micromonospora aurantiaca (nom. illeg.) TaxID=47850 RepID=A0A6N3K8A5_9ACTN|nr:hypothetical protein [Micromonospora aurantiaca]AXH93273.1 hypothetical protein DVH21_26855 [Micromonospora aurantiaca]
MTGLYVQAAHHAVLPTRDDRHPPRPRFVEYQADLHRMAGVVLDEATLTRGDQYTFVDLADALADRTGPGLFRDLGVLVTSYWTPEFDPDVSAFGPYLHHRHRLDCTSFDLVDQGSISPALALLVLCDFLRAGPADRDGLLLSVEQTTVPAPVGAHFPGPSRSTTGAVRIGRRPAGTEILTVTALGEPAVLGDDGDLSRLVARWCAEYDVDPAELTVRVNRATFLYRRWAYAYGPDSWPCRIEFLPPERTCTGLFRWLGAESTTPAGGYVAYVEEDVESLSAAVVLTRAVTP